MLGWNSREPPRLVPFAEAGPQTFCQLLCDGATAHNLTSFAELMAVHSALQLERPDRIVLATLDDLGQACYTCGHATDFHGLDDVEGHDLSSLPMSLGED